MVSGPPSTPGRRPRHQPGRALRDTTAMVLALPAGRCAPQFSRLWGHGPGKLVICGGPNKSGTEQTSRAPSLKSLHMTNDQAPRHRRRDGIVGNAATALPPPCQRAGHQSTLLDSAGPAGPVLRQWGFVAIATLAATRRPSTLKTRPKMLMTAQGPPSTRPYAQQACPGADPGCAAIRPAPPTAPAPERSAKGPRSIPSPLTDGLEANIALEGGRSQASPGWASSSSPRAPPYVYESEAAFASGAERARAAPERQDGN